MASVADVLRQHGYSTAAFGKWHNTPLQEITPVGPFDRWPTGLGFEYFYGNMFGMTSQWEPVLWRNTWPVQKRETTGHVTTELVDDAIRWIHTHQSLAPAEPYFVYFATLAAHVPHHVPKEWIEQYRGKFDQGWDSLRMETFSRQKRLGVVPENAVLTPRPKELPAWSSLSSDEKRFFSRQMEVYAAFIAHTDHEVGRLLRAVNEGPGADNTLILYVVGDNGGEARVVDGSEDMSVYVDRRNQRSMQSRLLLMDDLGGPQYFNTYAAGWAWAGSTPFQWTKVVASHLGATRNPLVVSWPLRIKDRGGLRRQFTHVIDVAPTLYEAAGIPVPETLNGVKQQALDGSSFLRTFIDANAQSLHTVQYFELYGNRAIYEDGWFASARHEVPWITERDEDFDKDQWELFDLDTDFSQSRNLADRHPQKLAEMKALFEAEGRRNNVFPLMKSTKNPVLRRREGTSVYHQGFPGLPAFLMGFTNANFQVVASLVSPPGGVANGVITAYGGRDGGFSLYVRDGILTFETNDFGRSRQVLRASQPLPAGEIEIRYEHILDASMGGAKGRLYLADKMLGEVQYPMGLSSSLDYFDVGLDSNSPVSDAYESPFEFSGTLNSVVVKILNKPGAASH